MAVRSRLRFALVLHVLIASFVFLPKVVFYPMVADFRAFPVSSDCFMKVSIAFVFNTMATCVVVASLSVLAFFKGCFLDNDEAVGLF